jgi:hypothetical protein
MCSICSFLKHLVAPDDLGVLGVLDLHPTCAFVGHVRATLPLRNHSLKVLTARELEEVLAASLDVIDIKQAGMMARHDFPERTLPCQPGATGACLRRPTREGQRRRSMAHHAGASSA